MLPIHLIISGEGYFLARRGENCADYNALYINDKRTCQSVAETLKTINYEVGFNSDPYAYSDSFRHIQGCYLWGNDWGVRLNRGADGIGKMYGSYQKICLSG